MVAVVAAGAEPTTPALAARRRVLGWYLPVVVLGVGVALGVGRTVLFDRLDRRVDTRLSALMDQATVAGDLGTVLGAFVERPRAASQELYVLRDGAVVDSTRRAGSQPDRAVLDRWAAIDEPSRGEVHVAGRTMRFAAVPVVSGAERAVLVATDDPSGERDDLDAAVLVLGAVSLSTVLIASLLAWRAAGQVLGPLDALASAARAVGEDDLAVRAEVVGDDEVAELARDFNAMLDRLSDAVTTRRELLDDVGHELRAPITIIRGHLQELAAGNGDGGEVAVIASDELDRMSRLVEDLLVLARAGRPDFIRPQPIDLADFVTSAFERVRRLGERCWVMEGRVQAVTDADPDRLTQAVTNLAVNAIKHTRPGDQIGIGAAEDDGEVRIWVRDTGPGVPAGAAGPIFERRRGEVGGTGLGLAIVRAIAEAHGGAVSVSSSAAGATFTIHLPKEAA